MDSDTPGLTGPPRSVWAEAPDTDVLTDLRRLDADLRADPLPPLRRLHTGPGAAEVLDDELSRTDRDPLAASLLGIVGGLAPILGIPIVVDDDLPPGVIELRGPDGSVLENPDGTPARLRVPVTDEQLARSVERAAARRLGQRP